jgi:hypothetical protein
MDVNETIAPIIQRAARMMSDIIVFQAVMSVLPA